MISNILLNGREENYIVSVDYLLFNFPFVKGVTERHAQLVNFFSFIVLRIMDNQPKGIYKHYTKKNHRHFLNSGNGKFLLL